LLIEIMSEDAKPKAESQPKKGKPKKEGGKKEGAKKEPKKESKPEEKKADAGAGAEPKQEKAKKPRKKKEKPAAAKEEKSGGGEKPAPKAEAKEDKKDDGFAVSFTIPSAAAGELKNSQIKPKIKDAFFGFGAIDEVRVTGEAGQDRVGVVFLTRVLSKGDSVREKLLKKEQATIALLGQNIELFLSDAKGSGGGSTSGTSHRTKNEENAKKGGRGRGRGREAGAAGGEEPKAERARRPSPPRIGPIGRASGGPKPSKFIPPDKAAKAKAKKEEEAKKAAQKAGGKEESEAPKASGKKEAAKKA